MQITRITLKIMRWKMRTNRLRSAFFRFLNRGSDPDFASKIITISLAVLFCCVMLMSSAQVFGAKKRPANVKKSQQPANVKKSQSHANVRKSGKHGLNLRTKVQGDAWREVVQGQITEVRPDGIVMDSEFFKSSRLQDDHETGLMYTDIYVGLTASVVYNGSMIEKIIVHDLKRPMVIRDKKFIEQERAKALRGR